MVSFRAASLVAAPVFLMLTAPEAFACSCEKSTQKEKFAKADLVVRGRMRLVTYGIEMSGPVTADEVIRGTRGDFEIEKVLKGTFTEKTVSIYTGSGMGDCGRLGDFLNAAYYYHRREFGVYEFGLVKSELAGQTVYVTTICDYAKSPKDEQE